MVRFNVPPTASKKVLSIDKFRGVDLTNSPTQISISRSPEAVNMIRDTVGSIRKRMGYKNIGNFSDKIHGVYTYNGKTIIFAGRSLYDEKAELLADIGFAPDEDSEFAGFEMGGKLYIKGNCGEEKSYLAYDGTTVEIVSENAYIPHVFAGKRLSAPPLHLRPSTAGDFIEPHNLAGYKWRETFGGETDGGHTILHLSRKVDSVTVRIMQEDGEWAPLEKYNLHEGKFHVTTSYDLDRPPYVPFGEDWLEVTAEYHPAETPDNVKSFRRCNIKDFSGVNGARNVVLFAGDAENPNKFFYSKEDNPTYFPDTSYNIIGESNSAIMGFSAADGRLAVHKDDKEDVAVYMCQGEFEKDSDGILKTVFRIVGSVKGEGAVSRDCFASLDNDPLFLTRSGVHALTVRDIMGGTISQLRSYYINGELRKFSPPLLKGAHACVYKDFYMLCIGGKVYVLDGLQKAYEQNEPQSAFQYECYVLDNINADFMWAQGDDLYFARNSASGEASGASVYKFFSDKESIESYNDDGKPIEAYWDLPELYGNLFYRNKTFTYLAVQLNSAIATGLELHAQIRGLWKKIGENFIRGRYFSWNNITWSMWTWVTDQTTRTLTKKFRIKKIDKARYRLLNGNLNEPFAIYSAALEFSENRKYKG